MSGDGGRNLSLEAASVREELFVPAVLGEWAETVAARSPFAIGWRTGVAESMPFGEAVTAALRAPFSMGDREAPAALLRRAASSSPAIHPRRRLARFPSLAARVEADAKGWLQPDDAQHRLLLAEAREDLRPFVSAQGSAASEISAHIITADP